MCTKIHLAGYTMFIKCIFTFDCECVRDVIVHLWNIRWLANQYWSVVALVRNSA